MIYEPTNQELSLLMQRTKAHAAELHRLHEEVVFFRRLLEKQIRDEVNSHESRVKLILSHLLQVEMIKVNVSRDHLLHHGNLNAQEKGVVCKSLDFLKLEDSRIEEELRDVDKVLKNIRKEIVAFFRVLEISEPMPG